MLSQFVLTGSGANQSSEFIAEMTLVSKAGIVGHVNNFFAAGEKPFG